MNAFQPLLNYFRGAWLEMRKVTWPTWPTLVRHFFSVLIGAVLAIAFVGGLDYLFLKALSFIINKQA